MNVRHLKNQFWRLGARVMVSHAPQEPFALEVARDELGEHFSLRVSPRLVSAVSVVDVRPALGRLLLEVRERPMGAVASSGRRRQFLCGRESESLFVFELPQHERAMSALSAMEALEASNAASPA